MNVELSYFEKRTFKNKLKQKKRDSNSMKDIISNVQLVTFLEQLDTESFLPCFFMALSGRRATDIENIETKNVTDLGNSLLVTLNGDKCNSGFVGFSLVWDSDKILEPFIDKAKRYWSTAKRSPKPFSDTNWQKIRRSVSFRLHSLRNRKAIISLMEGKSVEEVKILLGWADINSLARYTKVDPGTLKLFSSYDDFVIKLKKK